MEHELGRFRLYAMRLVFFLTAISLLSSSFQALFLNTDTIEPLYAVAMSFWLALSLLAVIGVVYPVKMLPILFIQLCYKAIWLAAVGIPLWSTGQLGDAQELFVANSIGVVLDILVIPWPFVFKTFFPKPTW